MPTNGVLLVPVLESWFSHQNVSLCHSHRKIITHPHIRYSILANNTSSILLDLSQDIQGAPRSSKLLGPTATCWSQRDRLLLVENQILRFRGRLSKNGEFYGFIIDSSTACPMTPWYPLNHGQNEVSSPFGALGKTHQQGKITTKGSRDDHDGNPAGCYTNHPQTACLQSVNRSASAIQDILGRFDLNASPQDASLLHIWVKANMVNQLKFGSLGCRLLFKRC